MSTGDWAVIAHDNHGVTVETTGPDPEALADKVASWAQQEADKWPEMALVYMLIEPGHLPLAREQEAESAKEDER